MAKDPDPVIFANSHFYYYRFQINCTFFTKIGDFLLGRCKQSLLDVNICL